MSKIQTLKNKFISKLRYLALLLKKHPVLSVSMLLGLLFVFILGSGGSDITPHNFSSRSSLPFEEEKDSMTGVKESVDPRDVWTANIKRKVDEHGQSLAQRLENIEHNNANTITQLQSEISELKSLLQKEQERQAQREFEESLRLSNQSAQTIEPLTKQAVKSLGAFSREYSSKKKNIKEYVPAGTLAKAVIVQGVVVGTGNNTQSNPEPIVLRLTDVGLFSKGKHTDQIKEAMIIGSCEGNLASERAKCRLHTLSLENDKGELIERQVKGWVSGEDGRNGIKGFVVDKSSDMLRLAMLNGVLGGMSSFLQNQSTKGIFPISPISGQQNALTGMEQLKGGVASGAGNAFSKMADFVMNRFDSMSPQIVITSNREVAVVFKEGFDLHGEEASSLHPSNDGNLNNDDQYNPQIAQNQQAEGFQKTIEELRKNQGSNPSKTVF